MDKLDEIRHEEEVALLEYTKTRDPHYLQIVLDCMNKREELLVSKLPAMSDFLATAE